MQQSVLDEFLQTLGSVRAGRPRSTPAGLAAVPLLPLAPAGEPARPPPRGARPAAWPDAAPGPRWDETVPPRPGLVRVRNRSATPVVVARAVLLDGGMSARAVRTTMVLPGHAEATVAVAALGARWWDEGPVRGAGSLAPAAEALLLQAGLAGGPTAASARTALSSLSAAERTGPAPAAAETVPVGWLLVDAGSLIAGWVAARPARPGPGRPRRDGDPALAGLLDRPIPDGLVAYALEHRGGDRELVLLPAGRRLVDLVVGASAS